MALALATRPFPSKRPAVRLGQRPNATPPQPSGRVTCAGKGVSRGLDPFAVTIALRRHDVPIAYSTTGPQFRGGPADIRTKTSCRAACPRERCKRGFSSSSDWGSRPPTSPKACPTPADRTATRSRPVCAAIFNRMGPVVPSPGAWHDTPLFRVQRVVQVELVEPLDAGRVVDAGNLPRGEIALVAANETAAAFLLIAGQGRGGFDLVLRESGAKIGEYRGRIAMSASPCSHATT